MALDEALGELQKKENLEALQAIVAECEKIEDPMQKQMAKMSQLIPKVQEMLKEQMEKRGFKGDGAVMAGMMQIQMASMADPGMQAKVQKVQQALSGKFDALAADKKDGEECD